MHVGQILFNFICLLVHNWRLHLECTIHMTLNSHSGFYKHMEHLIPKEPNQRGLFSMKLSSQCSSFIQRNSDIELVLVRLLLLCYWIGVGDLVNLGFQLLQDCAINSNKTVHRSQHATRFTFTYEQSRTIERKTSH